MTTYNVNLSSDEYAALSAAVVGGALQKRNDQLTALMVHNRDHTSIANSHEREIDALARAGSAILFAKSQP